MKKLNSARVRFAVMLAMIAERTAIPLAVISVLVVLAVCIVLGKVFCPTGAIKKIDEGGVFGIVHRPSVCMQCRLRERICPKQAISVSSCVPMNQFMGKEAVCFSMTRPAWTPNKPESMYNKVHSMLGDDLEMCMF